jgi:hypothetical protein
MTEKISMNVNETLELDYLVEQVSDNTIDITSEPSSGTMSVDYINTRTGVLNPSTTGTYKLDINGQTIEIEVTHIPDSGADHQWNYVEGSGTVVRDVKGSLNANFTGINWQNGLGAEDYYALLDGNDDRGELGDASKSDFAHFVNQGKGTLFSWVKPDVKKLQYIICSQLGNSGENNNHISFLLDQDKSFRFDIMMDGVDDSKEVAIKTGTYPVNEWFATAAVVDGSNAYIYKATQPDFDVVEVGSDTFPDTASGDLEKSVNLGGGRDYQGSYTRYFNGSLDIQFKDASVWSQSELQSFVDDSKNLYL